MGIRASKAFKQATNVSTKVEALEKVLANGVSKIDGVFVLRYE